jgi:hypothetical protein
LNAGQVANRASGRVLLVLPIHIAFQRHPSV